MDLLKEFCAENLTLVHEALAAGARRIELCDNLAVGGTTPSYGVIKGAVARVREQQAQVMTMIRPRGGNFCYSSCEARTMLDDIACARSLGTTGVVFGCVRSGQDGRTFLDEELVKQLVEAAKGPGSGMSAQTAPVQVTFHMAFDELDEQAQLEAIDTLAQLGVDRILTHGGPLGTPILDNLSHLKVLVSHAAGRLIILPGGGISWQNAEQVASLLGVAEVHGTKVVRLS